ncbi:hypothetical protein VD0004_g3400 [Verticillium dahliae]|nr:hypothetical protein VD0004_g3400 [Verticillium dahliae]PNH72340.1 hypothetical protein VD0001_g5204 [Verticillium dahliae]
MMDSLKAPNFIPPWATSLLGGNRKEGAFPSKEAVSHNDNVRTDGAGLNPKLSEKQCVRTASVYPVNSSEAPNDTDGSDEVDDNDDEDDDDEDDEDDEDDDDGNDEDEDEDNDDGPRNLPRSSSLETAHTDSDAALPQSGSAPAGGEQPSFQSENRPARAELSTGYGSPKPKHSPLHLKWSG